MRKSTRNILIASGICFIVGVLFIIYGGIRTGHEYSLKEIVKANRFGFFSAGSDNFEECEYELLESYDSNEFDNIEVKLSVMSLKVSESKDGKCNLYVGVDNDIEVYANVVGNKLEIKDSDKDFYTFNWFDNFDGEYAMLELPADLYENFAADIDAGSIYIEKASLKNDCDIDVDAGSIQIDELEAEDISLKSEMGKISVNSIKADKADFRCEMGDIELGKVDVEDSVLRCDMGNISAVFKGNSAQYDISKKCDMGNIDIEHSSVKMNLAQTRTIDVQCDMGNIDIAFEE